MRLRLHADERLEFGKDLSSEDNEPPLWRKDYSGLIEQWIEVGLPDEKLLRRASSRAAEVGGDRLRRAPGRRVVEQGRQ